MGKRLLQQRRGKGSPSYTCPSHRYRGEISYPKRVPARGTVVDIVHCPGHNAPLAILRFENNKDEVLVPASEGLLVGQEIMCAPDAEAKPGNILPLSAVPEGTTVYNIELIPGDGGRMIHTSGGYGYLVSREGRYATVRMPSGAFKSFPSMCLATVGIVAGGGRTDKPFAKAGKKHYKMHARNVQWPTVSATAKNPVDHPFGGGGHQHIGKSATVSRSTPPGRKVGCIAARRTGRKR